jgi:hypothetical protein
VADTAIFLTDGHEISVGDGMVLAGLKAGFPDHEQ